MTPKALDALLDKYMDGTLDDVEHAALQDELRHNPEARDRFWQSAQFHSSLRSLACAEPHRQIAERTQAQPAAIQLTHTRTVIYSCVAAAVLLMATGMIALLWVSSDQLTEHQKRRQQVFVEQLRELDFERKAIEAAKKRRRPRPRPAPPTTQPPTPQPPTPEEASRAIAELAADEAEEARDAEEAARFIDARRRFVLGQLRQFGGQGTVPEDLDIEDFDTRNPIPTPAAAVAKSGPVEVGRVLETEGEGTGVVFREVGQTSLRLELKKDLAVMSGDRIETARGMSVPCTSLELKGGATIDMDRATSVEVQGRDNIHLHTGRIYAHISVPYRDKTYSDGEAPFSLQTEAGRLLTHDLYAELQVSSAKELRARVDSGKAHLMNRKGHVVGHRGQELRARRNAQPSRRSGFTERVWRGRDRNFPGLPFGFGCPIVYSSRYSMQDSGDCYAIAMALRGEIALRGLQTLKGFDNPRPYYDDLFQVTEAFRSVSPHRIPRATLGSSKSLKKPASGIATETRSERSDAARQILAAAKTATPSKPLLVLCQGSMRDVACAWLMDPSIADRVVVAGDRKWANAERRIRGRAYGPPRSDPWAFEIVATHFRCLLVNLSGLEFGPELSDRVTDPKWCSLKKCGTGTHCGFGLLYHVSRPDHQITIKRLRFVRVDKHRPVFEEDPEGKTWEIDIKGEREKLRDEFRRVFLRRHR